MRIGIVGAGLSGLVTAKTLLDEGARPLRSRNPAAEFLLPVNPALYADLRAELEAKRAGRERRRVWAGRLVGAADAAEPEPAAIPADRET